ncbi:MAG TPA: DUF1080 domain-containing protein [Tepidisphaeraceae bacterium]|jgi:hypothetical protein|nr:DUF1080 domain-containing protein [Tepidisphaeraceae bacterium]
MRIVLTAICAFTLISCAHARRGATSHNTAMDPKAQAEGYEVHDMKRPQPVVVTPGEPSTQDKAGSAPSDAIVLFDGKNLSMWSTDKGETAKWTLVPGDHFEVKPHTGVMRTRDEFGDVQLHIEWREHADVKGESQGRGNSGVFLMGLYEIQVLDNYGGHQTYPDGSAGGIYGQYPPLANASHKPGEWNFYDIIFHRAHQNADKTISAPARVTLLWNGVLVQDNMSLIGPTTHKVLTSYPSDLPERGPLVLQDHGNVVDYRNVWLRQLPSELPKPPVRSNGSEH